MEKVLIFGTFDSIHPGHLFLIAEAKKYGEVHAIVALDETVRTIKGRDPVYSLNDRLKNLSQFGVVVHSGDAYDRLKVVREVAPDVVVVGYDQKVFIDELERHVNKHDSKIRVIRASSLAPDIFKSKKIRAVLDDPQAALVLIDKPRGDPSFRTVRHLRAVTGIRQIGFSGTLDPLASGLLIVGISKATTLLDWFHEYPKTYEAEVRLGVTSDTYDIEGALIQKSDRVPDLASVEGALASFVGTNEQIPPMYSAKKVSGQKLYEIARQGKTVERKKQRIMIHVVELTAYQYPILQFRVSCSSGTYIRSLAHDIGAKLGMGGVLAGLRRTAIGPYEVGHAVTLEQATDDWRKHTFSAEEARVSINDFYRGKLALK